jgi:hypothetical protein
MTRWQSRPADIDKPQGYVDRRPWCYSGIILFARTDRTTALCEVDSNRDQALDMQSGIAEARRNDTYLIVEVRGLPL